MEGPEPDLVYWACSVQLLQVIPHGILTLQLDQRGQNGVGGAGGGGVGHNDHILILGIQQVIPAGGIIIPFVREQSLLQAKAMAPT